MLNFLKIFITILLLISICILVLANQLETSQIGFFSSINRNNYQNTTENFQNLKLNTEKFEDHDELTEVLKSQDNEKETDEPKLEVDPKNDTKTSDSEFKCPSFEEINKVPRSCSMITPKYRKRFNSNFVPIYSIGSPGPSEATNGFRQVFMAAAILEKGTMITNFTKHKRDNLTIESRIPFGIRIDTASLCQYVQLTSSEEHLKQLSLKAISCKLFEHVYDPETKTYKRVGHDRIYLDEIIASMNYYDKIIAGEAEIN